MIITSPDKPVFGGHIEVIDELFIGGAGEEGSYVDAPHSRPVVLRVRAPGKSYQNTAPFLRTYLSC